MRITMFVLALILGLGTTAPGARSAPDAVVQKARTHYQRGRLHYTQREFAQAIREFRKAQTFRPHPFIHFVLGQCYRKLKRYEDALFAYKLYLSAQPRAANRGEVRRFVRQLERTVKERNLQRRMGRLSVVTEPEGVQIFVNTFSGAPTATAPAILKLKAGAYVLELRRAGYRKEYRKVVVKAGDVSLLRVTLVSVSGAPRRVAPTPRTTAAEWVPAPLEPTPVSRPAPARTAPVARHHAQGGAPLPGGAGPGPGPVAPPDPAPRYDGPPHKIFLRTWWFWTGMTLATLGFAGGGLGAKRLKEERADDPPDPDSLAEYKKVRDIGLGVGGAVLGVTVLGVVLYEVLGRRKQRTRRPSAVLLPACGPRGCGLTLTGRF